MPLSLHAWLFAILLAAGAAPAATHDARQLVPLPDPMQRHMLANMRDHLSALNDIIHHLAQGRLDEAADTAENRLGMSSLPRHGARHMAAHMPEGMRRIGTRMHHAASRFARMAQEGDRDAAYRALADITAACVACHGAYRVR